MNFLLNYLPFLLAQNEAEKRISMIGLIILGIIIFVFVVDSTARYKSDYVPKSKAYKAFLVLFLFAVMAAVLILFRIYYK